MFAEILSRYGLDPQQFSIQALGAGLVNTTWKVSGKPVAFVLQRLNTQVFTRPDRIAENLLLLDRYLCEHAPDYLFPLPLPALSGETLVDLPSGVYRLMRFVDGSVTRSSLSNPGQAYEAAKQFGKFSALLNDFPVNRLQATIPRFHDLDLRLSQFRAALKNATPERRAAADGPIREVLAQEHIATSYRSIRSGKSIPVRVAHHDTKISNVLFDDTGRGLCVIDLDTVMPGYFFSDTGDMMRTYLAEANEEETNLEKIVVRPDFFRAIYQGYMDEMGGVLSAEERGLFTWSGKFLVFMQAVRFLADYLDNDRYYRTTYPGQNLSRAMNQLTLLKRYSEQEPLFSEIVGKNL